MKWLMLVVGLLAPALAGCQVTPEFVKALVCEPADPPPVDHQADGSGTTGAGSTGGGSTGSHTRALTNSGVT